VIAQWKSFLPNLVPALERKNKIQAIYPRSRCGKYPHSIKTTFNKDDF
jgi:hypothetical protein